jgi:hypothetical protein
MRLRRKKNGQDVEVSMTETDQVVLTMSGAAERVRALDAEMLRTFAAWRLAQSRCRNSGLLVEMEMAEPLRAAYQTWMAEQYRDSTPDSSDAETGIIHAGGAGEPHGQVHGWPMRMMYAGAVIAW